MPGSDDDDGDDDAIAVCNVQRQVFVNVWKVVFTCHRPTTPLSVVHNSHWYLVNYNYNYNYNEGI